ncbi:MAG: hypothetical protein R3324_09350 [Halobacteriales archaeon]|nr:hypothetical protein [Halobacteriales archaeon]
MLGDSWPEEPDDPFPEYTDPVKAEGIDPEAAETAADIAEVPPAISRRFWSLVVVFNLGLLATALGLLLVVFRGEWLVGPASFGLGVGALGYGVYQYRRSRRVIQPAESSEPE